MELGIQGPKGPMMLTTCRVSALDDEKQALKTQALGLSLNYGFVTPLTSMVITKPEGQEQSQVAEKPVENGGCESGLLASVAAEFRPSLFPSHSPHILAKTLTLPHRLPGLPGDASHFIDEETEARSPKCSRPM